MFSCPKREDGYIKDFRFRDYSKPPRFLTQRLRLAGHPVEVCGQTHEIFRRLVYLSPDEPYVDDMLSNQDPFQNRSGYKCNYTYHTPF